MTLQELQQKALQLEVTEKWQLVELLLKSLKREPLANTTKSNLLKLRGIAKPIHQELSESPSESYVDYLVEKYQ